MGARRTDLPALGARIREARDARGLSQKQLGDLLEEAQSNVSAYELGLVPVPADVLVKILRTLEIPSNEWADWMESEPAAASVSVVVGILADLGVPRERWGEHLAARAA
jgi:transcriptional regulator with XRE-family HTH domain